MNTPKTASVKQALHHFHPSTAVNTAAALLMAVLLAACNPTKYVASDACLLDSYQVESDNRNFGREQLNSYVRQKPNKTIAGARFHLWLYNSSKLNKTNRWNEFLRKNGEEPVIWEQDLTDYSVEQMRLYLQSKGYYYATVSDTVILHRKRADVTYRVKTGWPYTVAKITYAIRDTAIAKIILADTAKSLIKTGMLFDHGILKSESRRIETNLQNRGYYSFVQDHVNYEADSTGLNRQINLTVSIKPNTEVAPDNRVVEAPYPVFHIRSVTVNASLSMQNLLQQADTIRLNRTDTLHLGRRNYIIPPQFPVKASRIRSAVFLYPDSLYRISNVILTQQHLNGLRNFNQITPEFRPVAGQTHLNTRQLDATISLLPLTRHSYAIELEGTNSEGNFGGGLRLLYQNKSLFGNAEMFDLRLRGLVEAVSPEDDNMWQLKAKMEYEAEATINIPKFLLPFRTNRFTRRYNPQTAFTISYNYQQYPQYYVRTVFNTSFGYTWRGTEITGHSIKPIEVNFVQLPNISAGFNATLNRYPYMKNSYQPHMVVSSSYTYTRDLRPRSRERYTYLRAYIESAGLLLNSAYNLRYGKGTPHEMFNNNFSQFIKGDIDLRYLHTLSGENRILTRLFAGVGWPYGNSQTQITNADGTTHTAASMPFEKKYVAGGANSIRGWQLRSLGPGSYRDSSSFTPYPNNMGDIKLEANVEYRFPLVWLIEGALFLDAGNVWDSRRDNDRPGAEFDFSRFYREIALSGGPGLRFDFKYIILRTDLGIKLHDPVGAGRWIFTPRPDGSSRLTRDELCFNITIGYPFF